MLWNRSQSFLSALDERAAHTSVVSNDTGVQRAPIRQFFREAFAILRRWMRARQSGKRKSEQQAHTGRSIERQHPRTQEKHIHLFLLRANTLTRRVNLRQQRDLRLPEHELVASVKTFELRTLRGVEARCGSSENVEG